MRCTCAVLHVLRRHGRLHDCRRNVSFRNARRLRAPTEARHGLAAAFRAPLDGQAGGLYEGESVNYSL